MRSAESRDSSTSSTMPSSSLGTSCANKEDSSVNDLVIDFVLDRRRYGFGFIHAMALSEHTLAVSYAD